MTNHTFSTNRRASCRCSQLPRARRGRGKLRRGYASVSSIVLITIGMATVLLVVNWTYLNLARERTQQLATTLSYSAVAELLDEGQLQDFGGAPPVNQADDLAAANAVLATPVTGLIPQHNAVAGEPLRVNAATDLTLARVRIEDASSPAVGMNFDPTPGATELANTLMVQIARPALGLNPVHLIIRGWGSPDAATIQGVSYATLDSRVVGFAPTATIASPVAPIAISSDAWFSDRTSGSLLDQNANGRPELLVDIRVDSATPAVNGAVVNLNETQLTLSESDVIDQTYDGIFAADVAPGGLGPATTDEPMNLTASQEIDSAFAADLETALLSVIASNDPRRVFPIYDNVTSDSVRIVGYIAATVIDVDIETSMSGDRLRIRLDPEFLIHRTVVTQYTDAANVTVPENVYIHKIRLTR